MAIARSSALLLALALTATFSPSSGKAQSQFVCTEFIGYSQMGNTDWGGWGPYAAQVMVGGGPDTVQLRWENGAAAFRWADPGFSGWNISPTSPCTRSSSAPDRVILDITHNEYLTAARTNGDPVGFMETRIRGFIAQARAHRQSARSIVLQPVVGGPNHATTCQIAGLPSSGSGPHDPNDPGVVRASYNHPYIHAAIERIVAGDVTMGYDSMVRTCADYNDWEGHLARAASQPIGAMIGSFYLNGGGQAGGSNAGATAPPPAQPDASNTPPSSPSLSQALPAPPADASRSDLWLVVLGQVQRFSPDMEPLSVATSGQWYRILRIEDGWMLGVWEFDPPDSLVWIELGPNVAVTPS